MQRTTGNELLGLLEKATFQNLLKLHPNMDHVQINRQHLIQTLTAGSVGFNTKE